MDNAVELEGALADPDLDGAVLDVRMPPTFTDEGLRAAIAVRQRRPGFPVVVLSQYVEQLYARELLADGAGAVGYLLKDRVVRRAAVRRRRTPCAGRWHRAGPGGRGHGDGPAAPRTAGPPHPARAGGPGTDGRGPLQRLDRRALHVTEKAVAKHINSIFAKLDLPVDLEVNRRVQAVLAYLRL